jgi:hypothetical protein
MQVHKPVWKLKNSSTAIRLIAERPATGRDESSVTSKSQKKEIWTQIKTTGREQ